MTSGFWSGRDRRRGRSADYAATHGYLSLPAASEVGERGGRVPGRARVVEGVPIDELLREKYGWQKRALDALNWRGVADLWVTIEIVDP